MAPSHLHPRSRMTSSLFATTVLASFFVVALPHVLPCPAPPRVVYADSDPAATEEIVTITKPDGTTTVKRRRRMSRRRKAESEEGEGEGEGGEVRDGIVSFAARDEDFAVSSSSSPTRGGQARGRECPVPKPGGVIGELMGFNNKKKKQQNIVDSSRSSDNHTNDSRNNRSSGSGAGDET